MADLVSPARIVIVDDEARSLELLMRTLRRLGAVESYAGAEAAWESIATAPPDVVISDQRMPGMTGVQLLTRVAALDPTIGRILLTGYADIGATIEAINQGRVHAYINKPWSPDQLFVSVRNVLSNSRLARENARLLAELVDKNAELETTLESLQGAQRQVVASERLAAIGRLIAMIVHDLRSPLTIVRASVGEIARDGEALPVSEVRALAASALTETERMVRMCSELLDSVRASEDRSARERLALDAWVEDVVAGIAESAGQAGVDVATQLASEATVEIDPDRLQRALLNLLHNAIEAMPEGGTLRVETAREVGVALLRVSDTGVGIPEEIRERIFEPFVTAGKRGGSGLGLAVVKKVIDDHRGTIRVGKAEGGGTAFECRLPLAAGMSA